MTSISLIQFYGSDVEKCCHNRTEFSQQQNILNFMVNFMNIFNGMYKIQIYQKRLQHILT